MAKKRTFAIGVDYGTNSVRALVVDTADGREVATSVFHYPSGEAGILLDPKDPTSPGKTRPTTSTASSSRSATRSRPPRPIATSRPKTSWASASIPPARRRCRLIARERRWP